MADARFQVGVQLQPQLAEIASLRKAWCQLDELGVDSLWVWDHFFPIYGDPDGVSYESWTLLGCMAAETRHATLGTLVSAATYRNADLLAYMAATLQHLSAGRAVLGIGAGWFERDYVEYGYEFGKVGDRSRALTTVLRRVRARLAALGEPAARVPVLVGGGGERVTLRLVAEHADAWNCFGPAKLFKRRSRVLDEWCQRVGRDPTDITRTVLMMQPRFDVEELIEAGAQHVIVSMGPPFGVQPVAELLAAAHS